MCQPWEICHVCSPWGPGKSACPFGIWTHFSECVLHYPTDFHQSFVYLVSFPSPSNNHDTSLHLPAIKPRCVLLAVPNLHCILYDCQPSFRSRRGLAVKKPNLFIASIQQPILLLQFPAWDPSISTLNRSSKSTLTKSINTWSSLTPSIHTKLPRNWRYSYNRTS